MPKLALVLSLVVIIITTTCTRVACLPDQAFFNNNWPSDLTDGSYEFPSGGVLSDPYIIKGQTNLNTITTSDDLAEVFNGAISKQVEVRTWNGAWIRNIYLPDESQISTQSAFLLKVDSSWGVTVHYNGGSVGVSNGETLLLALIDGTWLDEGEYKDLYGEPDPDAPDLFKATVLFAQSQTIPSKNRNAGDDTQPHLVANRKALVMLQPKDFPATTVLDIQMKVQDKDGNVVGGPITMNVPEDIPKHESYIDLGGVNADDIVFPDSLDSPKTVQGQSNLEKIGNDPTSAGLTSMLNTENEQVQIKTADGSWVRDIYFPEASTVPADSKIEIVCGRGYNVNIHYPIAGGGWKSKAYSKGMREIAILVSGMWLAENDLEHNTYIFGHNFYTAILEKQWVQPGMTLKFITRDDAGDKSIGLLEGFQVGAPTELMITTIDAGFLTEPRDAFTFKDDFTTHREYFETAPISKLIVVQYETIHLTEIMLPDGTWYTDVSDDEGGWHSGDMRQYIGKILLSHGIDMANYGINSSRGDKESPHPFTCALLAAHNTVGMYQNGRVVHGGSGGNGMVTITSSTGNEMSHEIGHNYGLGHYVDGFKGSVHQAASEVNSAWGWDSEYNRFTPNFSQINNGEDQCLEKPCQCLESQCQTPYLGKYQYGTDSMAGGSPNYSIRYTLYTPNTSRIIQEFMEKKAVWSETSSTGFRKYNEGTKQMEEFANDDNGNRVPSKYGVPVTTLVGFYDPTSRSGLLSYIYPALHGAYGYVYDGDGDADSDDGCHLIVTTVKRGDIAFSLSSSALSASMNKFHVNVATADNPVSASIVCEGATLASRALDAPKDSLEYSITESKSTSTKSACADDPTYRTSDRNKNCNWVNKKKCKRMTDQTKDACPIACQNEETCTLPKCSSDWKPNKVTALFQDCSSIITNKLKKKRACATKGSDNTTFAYQACAACGKCIE